MALTPSSFKLLLNNIMDSRFYSVNNAVIHDRIFWIYFIITLFFIIVGFSFIVSSPDPNMLLVGFFWLVSNISLMIIVYDSCIYCGPLDCENSLVCLVDVDRSFLDFNNRIWLFINILFVVLLILSLLWCGEFSHSSSSLLKPMSGILILFGGLILCFLATSRFNCVSFFSSLSYLVIWFGLSLYISISMD